MAQDMTDTRAFGYIFGSPDAGHKFFGIKSEKAASQVVIAMRDLFQVRGRGRKTRKSLAFRILSRLSSLKCLKVRERERDKKAFTF